MSMRIVARIAMLQFLVGLLFAALWLAMQGWRHAASALCGAGIAAVLTLYAGIRTFGRAGGDPHHNLTVFYSAQARKFLLAAVLFAVAVKLFGREFLPLITSFAAALTVYWFALLWNLRDG
jgi:F0F1-type ATP synthase assembly protein I